MSESESIRAHLQSKGLFSSGQAGTASAASAPQISEPLETPDQQGETVKGKPRFDPRTGAILEKKKILNPEPGGDDVWIDWNPATGGVFLDRGELLELSKIPDAHARLETILSG